MKVLNCANIWGAQVGAIGAMCSTCDGRRGCGNWKGAHAPEVKMMWKVYGEVVR